MRHRYRFLDPELLRALLAELDLSRLFNQLLLAAGGDPEQAMAWMRELQERGFIGSGVDLEAFFRQLEQDGRLERDDGGRLVLAAGGRRALRRGAFDEVFSSLAKADPGYHPTPASGEGTEALPETRPWHFGDELHHIDPVRSLHNALTRTHGRLELAEEDLEVHETEHLSACATVVAIDISHSMVLYGEDRITPAKTVALAMTELIMTRYPKDWVGVIVFGDRAWEIPVAEIPSIQAGPYHTNTCEALELGRTLLMRRKQANRQIFLITDGKPSAVTRGDGVYKNPMGLDMKIVNRTLAEADLCRRQRIVVTSFMVATDPYLQEFIHTLTRVNRGRAYFASPYNLGEYMFADYLRNRRRRVR